MQNTNMKRAVGRPRKFADTTLDRKVTLRITDGEHHALIAHGLKEQKKVSDLIRERCANILTV